MDSTDTDLPNPFTALDGEWRAICRRYRRSGPPRHWAATEPALAGLDSLADLIPPPGVDREPLVAAMVRLHRAGDELAGRALLQLVVPGLVFLAAQWQRELGRPNFGAWEVVGAAAVYLARLGRGEIACGASVAGNLLRSVHRDLVTEARRSRRGGTPSGSLTDFDGDGSAPQLHAASAEDVALSGPFVLDTIRIAATQGDITPLVAGTLAHVCSGASVTEACRRTSVGVARYYRHRRHAVTALEAHVLPEAV